MGDRRLFALFPDRAFSSFLLAGVRRSVSTRSMDQRVKKKIKEGPQSRALWPADRLGCLRRFLMHAACPLRFCSTCARHFSLAPRKFWRRTNFGRARPVGRVALGGTKESDFIGSVPDPDNTRAGSFGRNHRAGTPETCPFFPERKCKRKDCAGLPRLALFYVYVCPFGLFGSFGSKDPAGRRVPVCRHRNERTNAKKKTNGQIKVPFLFLKVKKKVKQQGGPVWRQRGERKRMGRGREGVAVRRRRGGYQRRRSPLLRWARARRWAA